VSMSCPERCLKQAAKAKPTIYDILTTTDEKKPQLSRLETCVVILIKYNSFPDISFAFC
jgi:hypothetical protein